MSPSFNATFSFGWSYPRDIIVVSGGLLHITDRMMTSSNGNISALLAICAGNSPVPGPLGDIFARMLSSQFGIVHIIKELYWYYYTWFG